MKFKLSTLFVLTAVAGVLVRLNPWLPIFIGAIFGLTTWAFLVASWRFMIVVAGAASIMAMGLFRIALRLSGVTFSLSESLTSVSDMWVCLGIRFDMHEDTNISFADPWDFGAFVISEFGAHCVVTWELLIGVAAVYCITLRFVALWLDRPKAKHKAGEQP